MHSQPFQHSGLAFLTPLRQMRRIQAMASKHGPDLAGPSGGIRFGQDLLFVLARVSTPFRASYTSGFGRGATRPPSITSDTESKIPVTDVAGRAEPFIVAMLDLFPALLTNCDHRRCLSHVGTEGNVSSAGKRQPQKT